MKVVLLESGRGNRSSVIAGWREKIGLTDDDSITLLSWYPPREMLPVDLHVVFGPKLHVRTRARSGAALADEIRRIREAEEKRRLEEGLDVDQAYDDADDADDAEAADAGLDPLQDETVLAEQLPEASAGAVEGSAGSTSPGSADSSAVEVVDALIEARPTPTAPAAVLDLPKHHPDRVKAALRWRARKVFYTAKASYPARKGRAGVRRAMGGIPSEFALAVSGWKAAPVVVGDADLVLSLDSRSQKAAWVLAQRLPGPAVVASFPAATRELQQRREQRALQG